MCTAGDVRLVPMQIEAEGRIASISIDEAAATLERVPDLEPPFVRLGGGSCRWARALAGR